MFQFPDGQRVVIEHVIQYVETAPVITMMTAAGTITYTASTNGDADFVMSQLDVLFNNPQILSASTPPTFALLKHNTLAGGALYRDTLTGAYFNASGINAIKFDDGSGNTAVTEDVTILNDSTLLFNGTYPSVATTYTVYYSTDFGATWTTTGKTAVLS